MRRRLRWFGSVLMVSATLLANCRNPTERVDDQDSDITLDFPANDVATPTADRYAFCEWREFEQTTDLSADLVGEWVGFSFEIDRGSHMLFTFRVDGTYAGVPVGVSCDSEPQCFGSGPDDLCHVTEVHGTWEVVDNALRLDDWPTAAPLNAEQSRENALRFNQGDGSLTLTAATCSDECVAAL